MDLPPLPADLYHYQQLAAKAGYRRVVGVDEAGRGPLAGPLVVAAVAMPPDLEIDQLNDSKQLLAPQREAIYAQLVAHPRVHCATVVISAARVDAVNIYQATCLGMRRAAAAVYPRADLVFLDGLPVKGFPCDCRAIVGGDGKCAAIAAASIIAKVCRDRLMRAYHERFPDYGFASHKGYSTPAHLESLNRLGPCPIHRRSFAPVARFFLDQAQGQLGI